MIKFGLHYPCSDCPFRKSNGIRFLGEERTREITSYVTDEPGKSFPCHKTLDSKPANRSYCAGSLVFMEKVNPDHPQLYQILHRIGVYQPDLLKGHNEVFDSVEDMVNANAG